MIFVVRFDRSGAGVHVFFGTYANYLHILGSYSLCIRTKKYMHPCAAAPLLIKRTEKREIQKKVSI